MNRLVSFTRGAAVTVVKLSSELRSPHVPLKSVDKHALYSTITTINIERSSSILMCEI